MSEHRQEFDQELEAIEGKVIELFAMVAEDLPSATTALLNGGDDDVLSQLVERDLGDELVTGAEQPGVAGGDRGAAIADVPLDDRLLARLVLGDRHSAGGRAAAVVAHLPSPSSIGTPTSEPYSVHDPS